MKIAITSPYLPQHAGGGEKHVLTTAWYLAQKHDVTILIPHGFDDLPARIVRYESAFHLDLSRVQWLPCALGDHTDSLLSRWNFTRRFDVVLYATDGSLFFSGAKRNILHIQFPFTAPQRGLINRLKLRTWNVKNANSEFTRDVVQKAWKTPVPFLHYPFVDIAEHPFTPAKKTKSIIAVGRFFDPRHTTGHAKRQEILVKAFIQGCTEHGWANKGVSLQLVGAIEPQAVHTSWVKQLKQEAKGYPITFHHDISFAELIERYTQSLIFWHAAGYNIDETTQPIKVEHFGMSTIEAMASGCIPVVVDKGGLRETVEPGVNGFRFQTLDELVADTESILTTSATQRKAWQHAARTKAETFSLERFCTTIDAMMKARV